MRMAGGGWGGGGRDRRNRVRNESGRVERSSVPLNTKLEQQRPPHTRILRIKGERVYETVL